MRVSLPEAQIARQRTLLLGLRLRLWNDLGLAAEVAANVAKVGQRTGVDEFLLSVLEDVICTGLSLEDK